MNLRHVPGSDFTTCLLIMNADDDWPWGTLHTSEAPPILSMVSYPTGSSSCPAPTIVPLRRMILSRSTASQSCRIFLFFLYNTDNLSLLLIPLCFLFSSLLEFISSCFKVMHHSAPASTRTSSAENRNSRSVCGLFIRGIIPKNWSWLGGGLDDGGRTLNGCVCWGWHNFQIFYFSFQFQQLKSTLATP